MGSSERSGLRVVGADGGGTRLRLTLADGMGRVLAHRESGPALLGPKGTGDAAATADLLREETAALARETGIPLPLDALCAGLAGAGRTDEARAFEARLRDAGVARRVRVVTDAEVALVDAFPEGPGILLVAGTGSIGLARDAAGRLHRVGGWGALLGDEGSGYALGLEGLRAAIRDDEGRGPATRLTGTLFEAIGAEGPEAALAWSGSAGKAAIAALAPRVAALGGAGVAAEPDPVARELVERAVRALVAHAEALAVGVEAVGDRARGPAGGPAGPPVTRTRVALAGGLVDPEGPPHPESLPHPRVPARPGEPPHPGGPLRGLVSAALDAAGFDVVAEPVDGARGAVRCALELLREP